MAVLPRTPFLAVVLACSGALASPTDNEFQQCHRRAAAALQFCLDEAPGGTHGPRCWTRSRVQLEDCYREVRSAHQRPPRAPPLSTP